MSGAARLALLCVAIAWAAPLLADATAQIDPPQATVGERIALDVRVVWPEGTVFEPPRLGPEIGPFTVLDGEWTTAAEAAATWLWSGHVAVYRTGVHELPSLRFTAGDAELATEPLSVEVVSVLEEQEGATEPPDIADLKSPASIAPEYGPLLIAAALLALLLLAAAAAWWAHRRFGRRLAKVAAPEDPFHRVPPHEWVYAEIQKLLAMHLPENGQVDRFYAELSRILKRYLSGRYRVELMEHTTDETPALLAPAALAERDLAAVMALLHEADRVKFAKERPDAAACKAAVEALYAIVDATKPRPAATPATLAATGDRRGAA